LNSLVSHRVFPCREPCISPHLDAIIFRAPTRPISPPSRALSYCSALRRPHPPQSLFIREKIWPFLVSPIDPSFLPKPLRKLDFCFSGFLSVSFLQFYLHSFYFPPTPNPKDEGFSYKAVLTLAFYEYASPLHFPSSPISKSRGQPFLPLENSDRSPHLANQRQFHLHFGTHAKKFLDLFPSAPPNFTTCLFFWVMILTTIPQ